MKSSILICILFWSLGVCAQDISPSVKDTSWASYAKLVAATGNLMYVVDGVPIEAEKIKKIDILERSILTGKLLDELYIEKKIDTLVLITTKHTAIVTYERIFGLFSRKYRRYLKAHSSNDELVQYVVNGSPLKNGENNTVKLLFHISKDSIVSVKFMLHVLKKGVYDYRSDRAALIIKTRG